MPPPPGWSAVTPRIISPDAAGLVTFLRNVFGAEGELVEGRPAEVHLGDSRILVSQAGERAAFPAFLYIYVDDLDDCFARATRHGVTVVEAPRSTPYGDRRAMFDDPFGNTWQIATPAS